jgi:catechol 2,3-dioxygenase-like lactoylglutathione lyase family enzyme
MAQASKIATVIVPMADQDAAVDFYVGKLGFETRVDIPFGPGPDRWIEVGLPGQETTIALAPPHPEAKTGGRETGISLNT